MTDTPPDPARCPLCGKPNACAVAAGHMKCWCFGRTISPEALERVPAAARGVVCLCASCGTRDEQHPPHNKLY